MVGGLNDLSAEELSRLSNNLNEATKNLEKVLKQQEQLLKNTLETEQKIISTRVAGLKEFNDGYSKILNFVNSEISAISAEMFKVTSAAEEAAASAEKAANSAKQTQNNSGGTVTSGRSVDQTVDDENRGKLGEFHTAENIAERYGKHTDAEELLAAARQKHLDKYYEARKNSETSFQNLQLALQLAREEADKENENGKIAAELRLKQLKLDRIAEVEQAELDAQNLLNQVNAEIAYNKTPEAAAAQARLAVAAEQKARAAAAAAEQKTYIEAQRKARQELLKLEAQQAVYIAKEKLRLARKNNGTLAEEESKAIEERAKKKFKLDEESLDKLTKKQLQLEQDKRAKENNAAIASATQLGGLNTENNLWSRVKSLNELSKDQETGEHASLGAVLVKALSNVVKQLDAQVDKIAEGKSKVDTRLQGSSNKTTWTGSYWDQIVKDMMSIGAVNPYFKQETFAEKIKEYVDIGIAFDLEQRAFLATISDKIATTFNAADATLLRLIRIQQEDSTAGRLGMEAALNAFLNEMYENTEYLKTVASSVRSSLTEMEALMDGAAATEVEYQVQKWLGSLYSVGMSQEAVTSISSTLGQIAAGQIEGLTGTNGAGNLLVMAANRAGIPIADILASGLDANETNTLLQAVVDYLAEIADSTKGNNVVQQQLANVFGVKASDLRAATNLASKGSISAVYDNALSYDNMLNTLFTLAGSMGDRTSIGEMFNNVWSNVMYSLAGGLASNPITNGILKAATLLEETTGGISLPFISVLGNGVDLNTTVADLMRVAAVGGGMLSSLGSLVTGLGNSFSGQSMLNQLGISAGSGLAITPRGAGDSGISSGGGKKSVSSSGYAGNASGSDIKDSTLQEAETTKQQLMIEAKEESEDTQVDSINTTVLKIYELLDDVAHGNSCFRVQVEGYGLTKTSSSALGGVNALLDNASGGTAGLGSSSGSNNLSSGGVNVGGAGSGISIGGWTTSG